MIELDLNATDQEISDAVLTWVDALTKDLYEEAYGLTWREKLSDSWTAHDIQSVIESYGHPNEIAGPERFRVTSPASAGDAFGLKSGRLDIERYDGNSTPVVASVTCDLALNGVTCRAF